MTVSAHDLHKEKILQEHLISALAAGEGQERRDPKADHDRTLAMDRALVLHFVRSTQPEAWERLTQHYTASAEDVKQLDKALKDRCLLDVLRKGIRIVPGTALSLCHFRPASGLEPRRVAEYQSNILSVGGARWLQAQAGISARPLVSVTRLPTAFRLLA